MIKFWSQILKRVQVQTCASSSPVPICKRSTESQDEREARWETARKKYAALSPDVMVARNKARRERQGGPPPVQAVIHLLLALLFPQCEALLVSAQC